MSHLRFHGATDSNGWMGFSINRNPPLGLDKYPYDVY